MLQSLSQIGKGYQTAPRWAYASGDDHDSDEEDKNQKLTTVWQGTAGYDRRSGIIRRVSQARRCDEARREMLASSAQHHQGDGPTSSPGPVRMGREQRAVYSGGLVVEVAILWKLGLSPSRVGLLGEGGLASSPPVEKKTIVDLSLCATRGGLVLRPFRLSHL